MAGSNRLSAETSPYLLQHASNPVHWYAWCDEAFERAKSENKLVLVSIGYSACHWCHVMEHEVFENQEAAEFMNRHFINIKVDREERPDIDQVYMLAVQLMTQRGGWPLNCFTLPDGRPVYGGSYFPLSHWMNLLKDLLEVQQREPARLVEYAEKLASGVKQIDVLPTPEVQGVFPREALRTLVGQWSKTWDKVHGGARRAPKFPMPVQLDFLLNFFKLEKKYNTNQEEKGLITEGLQHIHLTLKKMALGGIYDQVGGGFARYSVDDHWKVPHFEKMLYDNAQLVSVYANAFRASGIQLYRDVVEQTVEFIEREMTSPEGLIYSALDADSEGEEGLFYTWTLDEFKALTGDDFAFASAYFNVNEEGEWEHGRYILLRTMDDETFAALHGMGESGLREKIAGLRKNLLDARNKRIRPGLDDKCLTSWNAMMVSGYVDAYKATGDESFLSRAKRIATAMMDLLKDGNKLMHCRTKGITHIFGFLDDYVITAVALLDLYEAEGNEKWLNESRNLAEQILEKFADPKGALYWYNESDGNTLFARKKEMEDNVIPSSNSVLCMLLSKLAGHFENKKYDHIARSMLEAIMTRMDSAAGYAGWLKGYLWRAYDHHEVVITGDNAGAHTSEFHRFFIPNCIVATSTKESSLPLLLNRIGTNSAIYVCTGSTCLAPGTDVKRAVEQLV